MQGRRKAPFLLAGAGIAGDGAVVAVLVEQVRWHGAM